MNKQLHDILTLLMAKTDEAKDQAASKLSAILSSKTSKLVAEQYQYRKGYYGTQDLEDYEERIPVNFYGQPATLIFKGKQEVEVANSRGGWDEPPDSEIIDYLDYVDADVSIKVGDSVEDLILDVKFENLLDKNFVASYMAEYDLDSLDLFGKPIDIDLMSTMIVNAAKQLSNS